MEQTSARVQQEGLAPSSVDEIQLARQFSVVCRWLRNREVTDTIPVTPSPSQRLFFYGRYKQATQGDNIHPCPSIFSPVKRYMWTAWTKNKGKTRVTAMMEYLERVDEIFRTFDMSLLNEQQIRWRTEFLTELNRKETWEALHSHEAQSEKEEKENINDKDMNGRIDQSPAETTMHEVRRNPIVNGSVVTSSISQEHDHHNNNLSHNRQPHQPYTDNDTIHKENEEKESDLLSSSSSSLLHLHAMNAARASQISASLASLSNRTPYSQSALDRASILQQEVSQLVSLITHQIQQHQQQLQQHQQTLNQRIQQLEQRQLLLTEKMNHTNPTISATSSITESSSSLSETSVPSLLPRAITIGATVCAAAYILYRVWREIKAVQERRTADNIHMADVFKQRST